MRGDQTTKQILQEKLSGQAHTPLYNQAAIQKIQADFERYLGAEDGIG
jgi:hypothetical protein